MFAVTCQESRYLFFNLNAHFWLSLCFIRIDFVLLNEKKRDETTDFRCELYTFCTFDVRSPLSRFLYCFANICFKMSRGRGLERFGRVK